MWLFAGEFMREIKMEFIEDLDIIHTLKVRIWIMRKCTFRDKLKGLWHSFCCCLQVVVFFVHCANSFQDSESKKAMWNLNKLCRLSLWNLGFYCVILRCCTLWSINCFSWVVWKLWKVLGTCLLCFCWYRWIYICDFSWSV